MLKRVIDKYVKRDSIINGFRSCGLSPFNANAIDYSKCLATRIPKKIEPTESFIIEENTSIITPKEFIKIVGCDKIKQLDAIGQSNATHSADVLLLHKIYERLKGRFNKCCEIYNYVDRYLRSFNICNLLKSWF